MFEGSIACNLFPNTVIIYNPTVLHPWVFYCFKEYWIFSITRSGASFARPHTFLYGKGRQITYKHIHCRSVWIVYTKKRPSLLIFDSFSAHTTEGIKSMFERFNTTVIVIPGGCTLDMSVNRPFKDQLKKCREEYMLEQSDLLSDAEKINPPTKQHIVDWINEANKNLHKNATIVKVIFLWQSYLMLLEDHEDDQIRNALVWNEIDEIWTEVFGEHRMGFTSNSMESTTDPFESDTTMSSEDSASACDHECTSDLFSISDSDHSVSAPESEISDLEADPPSC